MFSFLLALFSLLYHSLCFWSFTHLTFVSSFTKVFAAFGNSNFFLKWSCRENSKKLNKNFQVKSHREAPGANQGGHPWSRRPGGAATPWPRPQAPQPGTSSSSLSFSPKTWVLLLELAFLLFFCPKLRSLSTTYCLSWDFSKYSLVCNSSTLPIRYLIGGFISEYLVVLGDV